MSTSRTLRRLAGDPVLEYQIVLHARNSFAVRKGTAEQ